MSVATLFFWIWAVAVVLALWALRVAQRFAVRMPKIAAKPIYLETGRFPRVAVILPIKGVDDDTPENLQALLNQDYPEYRLIFAVESEDDPVVPLLENMARDDSRIEVVVAGIATSRGQKIHNQLAAVSRTTQQDDVLAFLDADAKPNPLWLQNLAAPVTREEDVGASTGYRYYVPVTDHTANKIVSVLNAQVAALLGPYRRTFAWGGSMAIRRKDFYAWGLNDLWQHALSDDYVLSYCVKVKAKTWIHFVPNCLVASDANFNWASLFEFAVRQYRITKVCAPWVWLTAVGGALLFLVAFTYTLANSLYLFFTPARFSAEHLVQMLMFAILYGLTILRGHLLVRGGEVLLPAHAPQIARTRFWATLGMPWCYVINLLALLGSAVGRNVVWRGIAYQMVSRTHTIVQRPHASPASARRTPQVAKVDR